MMICIDQLFSGLNKAAILEPKCPFAVPKPMEMGDHRRSLEENSSRSILLQPQPTFGCRVSLSLSFMWQYGSVYEQIKYPSERLRIIIQIFLLKKKKIIPMI